MPSYTIKITANFRERHPKPKAEIERLIKDVLYDYLAYDTIEVSILEHKEKL